MYHRVIPERKQKMYSLCTVMNSLPSKANLFVYQRPSHSVRFSFSEGELKLNANTMEIGEGDVSMPVNYRAQIWTSRLIRDIFLDILRHSKKEVVSMGIIDSFNRHSSLTTISLWLHLQKHHRSSY